MPGVPVFFSHCNPVWWSATVPSPQSSKRGAFGSHITSFACCATNAHGTEPTQPRVFEPQRAHAVLEDGRATGDQLGVA